MKWLAPIALAVSAPVWMLGAQSSRYHLSRSERMLDAIKENYPSDRLSQLPKDDDRASHCTPYSSIPDSVAVVRDQKLRHEPQVYSWQYSRFSDRDTSAWAMLTFGFSDAPDTLRGKVVGQTCQIGSQDVLAEADGVVFGISGVSIPTAFDWDEPVVWPTPAVYVIRGGRYAVAVRQEHLGPAARPPRVTDSVAFETERGARAKAAASARVAAIRTKHWPPAITNLVLQKKIQTGMTAEMVRLSWGNPEKINRTITATRQTEQLVYGSSYVYLTNGVVTAIQDSR